MRQQSERASCTAAGDTRPAVLPCVPRGARSHPASWLRALCLSLLIFLAVPAGAQQDTWRINLKNADIQEFISQIATITGRTFVVDPRVRGRVTVISNASLDENGIYELFLSVLRVHGFSAIESGDVVRIQQQTLAKQSGSPLDAEPRISGEQIVTRVIAVQYVDASEVVQTLRPMVPQYGHLAAISRPNAIIISDHAENIVRLMAIIERIDVADDEQVVMVPLKEAWVGNIVELLERLAPDQIGSNAQGPQRIQVIANERTNSVVLRGKSRPIEDVRRLIAQLDQPATAGDSTNVIQLSHANAPDLAEILTGLVATLGNGDPGTRPVTIQADQSLNAIIARADPNTMAEIRDIVAQLDVRRTQVLIEAAIVEISLDDTFNFGVDMAAVDASGRAIPLFSTALQGALNTVLGGLIEGGPIGAVRSVENPTIGVARIEADGLSFGAVLQALATSSKANLLSTPSILTLDNQEARIVVGQGVPFRTGTFTTGPDGASNPFTTIQRQDVGLTLTVTPYVHDEGRSVRLQVAQEVENVVQAALAAIGESGFSDVVTNKRTIQTTVLANDGQTIVLGGLIQDDTTESQRKVPLLGDVPLLGKLFQSNRQERTKRNLVVFLRPTVIRTHEEATSETERKYSGIWETEISSRRPQDRDEERPPIEIIYEGRRQ
jgi:general secretion pathway protein D